MVPLRAAADSSGAVRSRARGRERLLWGGGGGGGRRWLCLRGGGAVCAAVGRGGGAARAGLGLGSGAEEKLPTRRHSSEPHAAAAGAQPRQTRGSSAACGARLAGLGRAERCPVTPRAMVPPGPSLPQPVLCGPCADAALRGRGTCCVLLGETADP